MAKEKTNFKIEYSPRKDFENWVKKEFPELKTYAHKKENYFDLGRRIDEVHEAAMLVLNLTMRASDSSIRNYYQDDLDNLRASYDAKDLISYIKYLDAFVDAIKEE